MNAAPPSRDVSRDVSLDVARGVAIVAVVLGHVVSGLIDAGAPGAPAWVGDLNRALYLTHLPVFAFLTGLLMPRGVERRGQSAYLRERLLLLLHLYLVWTFIQGSIEVLASSVTNRPTSWSEVLTVWTPLAHLWFLPAFAVATCVVVVLLSAASSVGHVTLPTVTDAERGVGSIMLGVAGSVTGVAAVAAVAALAARWWAVAGGLAAVGRQSLVIYLAHIIFAAGTREAFEFVGFTDFVTVLVAATVSGIIGPLALQRFTRPVPWLFTLPRKSARKGPR